MQQAFVKRQELAMLMAELEALDRLRAELLAQSNDDLLPLSANHSAPSLQDAVMAALKMSPEGISSSRIATIIGEKFPTRFSSERSLRASIHTTLKRLVNRHQIVAFGESPCMFKAITPSNKGGV